MLAAAVRLCGPLALLRPHVAPFCLDQETDGTIWYRIITLYRVLKMGDGSDRKRHKYKSVGYCGQHRGFTDTQRCTQSWAADISEPWLITVIFTFNDLMIIYMIHLNLYFHPVKRLKGAHCTASEVAQYNFR